MECASPTDEKKSAEVVENAAPVLLARKFEAEVVEKKYPLSMVVRCARADVVENARPRDAK